MSELLPCPFCGGEAHTYKTIAQRYCAICNEPFCANVGPFDTEAEAIAAWNSRAERTCHNVHGDDKYANFICSECGLHMHKPNIGRSFVDEDGKRWYGTSHEHALNYCPNCGRKVVGE